RPGRPADCVLGTSGPCPPIFHPVELLRIEANQGCAQIRERENGWFIRPRPEYPPSCPALVGPQP
ncbi:MAG TPA: hypothetical protein VFZ61_23795, partial [Polyangiales bacterium]